MEILVKKKIVQLLIVGLFIRKIVMDFLRIKLNWIGYIKVAFSLPFLFTLTLPARAAGSSDSRGIDEFFGARHNVNKSKIF
jgi:hypothetical protein